MSSDAEILLAVSAYVALIAAIVLPILWRFTR